MSKAEATTNTQGNHNVKANVELMQNACQVWATGGFYNPDVRDSNFDKYVSEDVIVDERFPAEGTPFHQDVSQLLHGRQGFFSQFTFLQYFEMKGLVQSTIPGFTPDTVLHRLTFTPVSKTTGKVASSPMSFILEFTIKDGKMCKTVVHFQNIGALTSLFH
jgi:hypothetical protein